MLSGSDEMYYVAGVFLQGSTRAAQQGAAADADKRRLLVLGGSSAPLSLVVRPLSDLFLISWPCNL
jgi:hypothetical protein